MTFSVTPQAAVDRFLSSLTEPARLMVAVSGGGDSIGLLFFLHEAMRDGRHPHVSLCAATVDHGLRPESSAEAAAVAAFCEERAIQHRILVWEGAKPASGLAAAAREARYALLAEAAEALDSDLILSAHTADDQVETAAMRAERNDDALSPGLAGMAPAVLLGSRVWLVRPLLDCRRAHIRALLQDSGIGWFDDPSNDDAAYERPRQRRRLRDADMAVALDDIRRAQRRRYALSAAAASFIRDGVTVHGGAVAVVERTALQDVDDDVLAYGLAALAAVIGGRPHPLSANRMLQVVGLCRTEELTRLNIGRVVFDQRREALFLTREARGILSLTLAAGGSGIWDGRYRIENAGDCPVTVLAAGRPGQRIAPSLFPDVPSGVALRAAAALPACSSAAGPVPLTGPSRPAWLTVGYFLAPFDRFLPLFDAMLACEIALKFARPCAGIPFRGLSTENEC